MFNQVLLEKECDLDLHDADLRPSGFLRSIDQEVLAEWHETECLNVLDISFSLTHGSSQRWLYWLDRQALEGLEQKTTTGSS